jgi:dTDP-4-dehydrorhamnose reductase
VYHCVNSGSCTWLDLARELARRLNVEPKLMPVRMADAKLKAQRPMYCVLSNAKLAALGITMPPWQDAIARYVSAL